VLAAAPSWFADNVTMIAAAVLLILTFLVLRSVKEQVTRVVLLVLILAVAVFVYFNRDPLKACAETCECQIADQDVSVPFCDPNLELA
jgi:Ca2+/Na+ antiporter